MIQQGQSNSLGSRRLTYRLLFCYRSFLNILKIQPIWPVWPVWPVWKLSVFDIFHFLSIFNQSKGFALRANLRHSDKLVICLILVGIRLDWCDSTTISRYSYPCPHSWHCRDRSCFDACMLRSRCWYGRRCSRFNVGNDVATINGCTGCMRWTGYDKFESWKYLEIFGILGTS